MLQFVCLQNEETRARVYFSNCCLGCSRPRQYGTLGNPGVHLLKNESWLLNARLCIQFYDGPELIPSTTLRNLVFTPRRPTAASFGFAPCCAASAASLSSELDPVTICDAAIWGLAELAATIRVCGGSRDLDCAAEKQARLLRRGRWRAAVYLVLASDRGCGVAPDVARQIVLLALPHGPLLPTAE